MPSLLPIRRALLSVSDKTGLVPMARRLHERGVTLVSTGGTAGALAEAGLPVTRAEQLTGFAEMMAGRVKTLHPAIHGAILARRDVDGDDESLRDHGITPIDLVCVNLYPFEQTVRDDGVTAAEALEQIDIGGPAMVRSAAKNHPFVAVLTAPDQYAALLDELDEHDGATTLEFRRALAGAAFRRTAEYDTAISSWMSGGALPGTLALTYTGCRTLRYGENPHQPAALYIDPGAGGPGIATAQILHGKPLSYNNILDAAAALELVQDLHALEPRAACATIIKHTNPCGAAIAPDLERAFELAYEADSLAAYGGILAVGATLDRATAARICEGQKFLEVIVAPDFDPAAVEMLGGRWKNVRLVGVGELLPPVAGEMTCRSIPGGMLAQQRDTAVAEPGSWQHVAGPAPRGQLRADAAFAWTVVKHLKSNAVALAGGGRMLGAGSGQVDRVSACRLAVARAGDRLGGGEPVVGASDAFFPFPDGPQLLIDAGVTCIVHPGGSKRDQETVDLCKKRGVTCLLTGVRHFRH